MKKRLNKRRKEKIQAYFQIINLIFGIIAIAFIIGVFNTGFVSSASEVKTSSKDKDVVTGAGAMAVIPTSGKWGRGYLGKDPALKGIDAITGAETITPATFEGIYTYGQGILGHMAEGLWWSMQVVMVIQFLGMFTDDDELVDAASFAAFGGIMAGKVAIGITEQWISKAWLKETGWWGLKKGTWLGAGTGIVVAAIIFYNEYRDTKTETITFTCEPWDAPTGGKYCEDCNKQGELPCSEYQCRSLGQSCQLLNPGTDEEKCAWINRNDVKYPIIDAWDDALLSEDYKYEWLTSAELSPPDRGVKVIYTPSTTGCTKAFTPLSFGVVLDEPAKCKIDFLRKDTFDDMGYYFGGSSLLRYNHTQVMSLPGPSAFDSENLTIQNDGDYELYVRCQDANGNHNTANFVFKYCIEKGPDTTPPLIVGTKISSGMPFGYEKSSIDFEIYVNEPADCRWSHLDQDYDNMEEVMDNSGADSIFDVNEQGLYTLTTTLTGLKDRVENKFYFRCKDNSENVNTESQPKNGFVLIGTQPLIIDWVKPNETVKDSTETVKVTLEAKTSAGYKEGEATCYYSETGEDDDYVLFFNTNSYKHSQDLWLAEEDYEYYIKCIDLGGNSDTKTVSFKVESDSESPIVVRAYHEETYLKLITNEEAECVYDVSNCNYPFDDGISMTVVDETSHFTDWNTNIDFYIKCRDGYGNEPTPQDVCSIIIRPFEVYM